MAAVYLAEDRKHKRRVAIKVVRPELAAVLGPERFLREIEITSQLNHPHIVPLHDSGQADGFLYYVMPYVDGESLRDRLNREKQLPVEDAIQIAREVADALSYAHNRGVIHRDVKPENILLESGHAVVADFGIARAVSVAGGERITATGVAVGTPEYMSPEQAGAGAELDARSDVYALGCVLYEMLTGQPPFTGRSAQAVFARHTLDPVPAMRTVRPGIPISIERAVSRALAKTPADRFRTAGAFGAALLHGTEGVPSGTQAVRPTRWVAAGLAAVVLIGGTWWTVHRATTSAAPIHALAVLPLQNLMGADQEYLVEGMHDALIGELSQISALGTVISRTSVMQYQNTKKTIPQIARELGVDGVVEGSVLRAGDSVRIQVQLIGVVPREHHVWAGTFDGELRNALALQKTLVSAIVLQISATLTPQERARLASAHTVNPQAYQLYLKGNYQLDAGDFEATSRQALDYFQQAIAADSTYAPAYAGLARAYIGLGMWGSTIPPEVVRGPARAAALGAIARDSTLAEAYIALGQIKWLFDWDWPAAARAFERGMELNPSSEGALIQYASYLTSMGRFDQAMVMDRLAVKRNPRSPVGYLGISLALNCLERYDEAVEQAQKFVELAPNLGIGEHMLAESYIFKGDLKEAARHTERAESLFRAAGDRSWLTYLVWDYARVNRRADALRVLSEMDPTPAVWQAVAYAGLGEKDKALDFLERAYERHEVPLVYMKVRHVLDPLRGDPRFQQVLRRMKFPD
jgi:serine/threonine-protein kinase